MEEVKKVLYNGLTWMQNGQERLTKDSFNIDLFDVPSRAAISNMNQYNRTFGCESCLVKEKRVEKGAVFKRWFPLNNFTFTP